MEEIISVSPKKGFLHAGLPAQNAKNSFEPSSRKTPFKTKVKHCSSRKN